MRALLGSGCLSRAKDDRNIWRVQSSLEVSFGKRGPALGLNGSDRFIVQRLFDSRVRVFDAEELGHSSNGHSRVYAGLCDKTFIQSIRAQRGE